MFSKSRDPSRTLTFDTNPRNASVQQNIDPENFQYCTQRTYCLNRASLRLITTDFLDFYCAPDAPRAYRGRKIGYNGTMKKPTSAAIQQHGGTDHACAICAAEAYGLAPLSAQLCSSTSALTPYRRHDPRRHLALPVPRPTGLGDSTPAPDPATPHHHHARVHPLTAKPHEHSPPKHNRPHGNHQLLHPTAPPGRPHPLRNQLQRLPRRRHGAARGQRSHHTLHLRSQAGRPSAAPVFEVLPDVQDHYRHCGRYGDG